MIRLRPANERGHAEHGWLNARHSFSFASYYDPEHMGFRNLRVLNDDTIQPGMGFGTHSHQDMEIVTYVFAGALEHKDSMGSGSVLRPGDVQRMSAGRGVQHSEFNHSQSEVLRLLQIWLLPESKGINPSYDEKHFGDEQKRGRLRLIVSPDGADSSLGIHQDVRIYASLLANGEESEYDLAPDRHGWLQVVRGSLALNGEEFVQGDGAAISGETNLSFVGLDDAEILFFDLN